MLGNGGECFSGPIVPNPVLFKNVEQNIAVYENKSRHYSSPRVKAMISSVLMRTVAFPRIRSTILLPRLAFPQPCG